MTAQLPTGVLEDPTGARARWLSRTGRLVFLLFLGWLLAILLGGLGLFPVAGVPLTHVLRPSTGPPPLVHPPAPVPPSASDLRPAVPAKAFAAKVAHGKSAAAPGRTKTAPAPARAHGKSSVAPGRTKTAPGAASSHGKSASAPGQLKTTATTTVANASHGKSAAAPGQATTTTVHRPKKP